MPLGHITPDKIYTHALLIICPQTVTYTCAQSHTTFVCIHCSLAICPHYPWGNLLYLPWILKLLASITLTLHKQEKIRSIHIRTKTSIEDLSKTKKDTQM